MLEIRDLTARIGDKTILHKFNMDVRAGEIHAVMGPNGSGKSTLGKVLAGDPRFTVVEGSVKFDGKDLLAMTPEDRSLAGVFLGFQYPVEIPGVQNMNFLRLAQNLRRKATGQDELDPLEFDGIVREKSRKFHFPEEYLTRAVNHGFSGGEKKRNEILQMVVLEPRLAILDEIDSGLDIDALRHVASAINAMRSPDRGMILITHYQRLLNYVRPDRVHVLSEGRIVKSGDEKLAIELEASGYQLFK